MNDLPPNDRADREHTNREADQRETPWAPPSVLPDPKPRPTLVHRWVRTSAAGQADPINVANSLREGWAPVHAADYSELNILSDLGSRWPESIEVGGLLLCSAPASKMRQRAEHYAAMTKSQIKAVNDQLDREEDPRLRTMFRDHRQSVTVRGFGPGGRAGRVNGSPPES